MPWASYKFDERGMIMRDENNMPILTGYCVEVRMKNIKNIGQPFYVYLKRQ